MINYLVWIFFSITTNHKEKFRKDLLFGVIDRIIKKTNPVRALIESVALTENYLQSIVYRIYRDFPYKLITKEETPDQQEKLLKIITESFDKEEIIARISEEKIRGIFYGKPIDFFTKDKARIGIDKQMETYYKTAIEMYQEIIARRNVFAHNNGKVDRKYLREVSNPSFKLRAIPQVDNIYLKDSIQVLHGIATVATKQAIESSYSVKFKGQKLQFYIDRFDKKYKNK